MSSVIGDIETGLVNALHTSLPELEVIPFPERPEDYEFIHPVGALLVQYDGGAISGSRSVGFMAQTRDLRFTVVSLTRNLRDHGGCYEVLQRVAACLLGLKLSGCTLIGAVDERFLSEADGVWSYQQTFSMSLTQPQSMPNYTAQYDIFENPMLSISGGDL